MRGRSSRIFQEQLTELGADTDHVAETFNEPAYDKEIRGIIETVKSFAEKYKNISQSSRRGIFDHKDVLHQFELGAEGVQAATRFVTTEECDADIAYKEAYINAKEEDIVIVKSPVGMPGRAIKNKFLERVAQGPVKVERSSGVWNTVIRRKHRIASRKH